MRADLPQLLLRRFRLLRGLLEWQCLALGLEF